MDNMTAQVNLFEERAKKMPRQLRGWEAYNDLTKDIQDFMAVLPLIQALSSHAMRPRHWKIIQKMSAMEFDNESPDLTVGGILATGLHKELGAVEAIRLSAERELEVEEKLAELQEIWSDTRFEFLGFKNKGPVLLKARELSIILDRVEESTNVIGTMVGHPHSEPFRDEVQGWIKKLTSVQEVLEQWMEVQSMWVYMEAVFSNSDIAKQLPQEKKRFDGIDKSYMKLMHKAFEISNVVHCCHGHEPMKTVLPNLVLQLEMCQKSLNGYFESKRLLFPRFFFISDALLLELLSDGSEPQKVMAHIGMLFDSLVRVSFDESEPLKIMSITADSGELVKLLTPLECSGMAEEYLEKLTMAMRATIHDVSRDCANEVYVSDGSLMSDLIFGFPGQVCLIGLQIYWTFNAQDAIAKTRHDKLVMNNVRQILKKVI
jgi:dynein heavy chain